VRIRFLAFLAIALTFALSPSWAASSANCNPTTGESPTFQITCQFTPATTSATFDFGPQGDGVFAIQFDTVLTTFHVTITANEVATITNLDPTEFPTGTVCITYTNGHCVRYDISGDAGGLNGVPVKGVDYTGLISLTLNYNSFQTVHIPAFGHAPGDNATAIFSEDILTSYVDPNAPPCTVCADPAMGGRTPGISPFAALDKPFVPPVPADGNIVCGPPGLTAVAQNSASGMNPIVEVSFQLAASEANCSTGPFLRDKTATLTVATQTGGVLNFTSLINKGDSNKFHFENRTGLNIQDINTNGLPSGTYFVTVTSEQFSPVTTTFTK
jgi:hypothetical protein